MIVKDEAAIIGRCLEALVPVIDAWVICDTGSQDNTPELIVDFFARHRVPGRLHHIRFVDFETARNRALVLAREIALDFDYLLLCDADMELMVESSSCFHNLDAAAYLLRQRQEVSYDNIRLLSRGVDASYVGATHEALVVRGDLPVARLSGAWFLDHACGASRSEKDERDLRLLEQSLARDPDDARTVFYLAQTHRDMGHDRVALDLYLRRSRMGGFEEEGWHSQYQAAECAERLGEHELFTELADAAFSRRPWRAEPLYARARNHRQAGRWAECLELCRRGEEIPLPEGDLLFVEEHVYREGWRKERSIAGHYSQVAAERTTAAAISQALAVDPSVRAQTRHLARNNLQFQALTGEAALPGLRLHRLEVPAPEGMRPMNTSLWIDDGEGWILSRCVNYHLHANGEYRPLDGASAIYTVYLIAPWNGGQPEEWSVVEDRSGRQAFDGFVRGLEDCRIFHWRNKFWAITTVRDAAEDGLTRIGLAGLDPRRAAFESFFLLDQVGRDVHQKNWMPVVQGESLRLIYKVDPTTVLDVVLEDRDDGGSAAEVRMHAARPATQALEHLRGGSNLLSFEDGWLALTHEVIDRENERRVYLHRFVRFGANLDVQSVTPAFRFLDPEIEFCAGLAREKGHLFASFGVLDKQAWLAEIPLESVVEALAW
ncbi:MAG: hypothetical protein IFK92_03505 [Acidobacteria bacterium]|nr:hypothetical protein [Candidatus Sulfomarinibacter kjeldsenii]